MNALKILQRYFPVPGTAESDREILESAFVNVEESLEVLNPPVASPRLMIGRKGSGKSAYLNFFRTRFLAAGIPVLLLKPEDLDLNAFEKDDAMGEMVKKAKTCIQGCIADELGKQLGTFLTAKHEATLSSFLVASGAKPKDFIQKLHTVLTEVAKAATSIDFEKISNSLQSITPSLLREAIYQNVGVSGKVLYVMLDDTDQVALPTDPNHLNRIWAFILAARSILGECHEIRIIISLRLEVWIRLQRDNAGQRDQVDHFRGLIYELNPSEEHVRAIVMKRLELAKADAERKALLPKLDTVGGDLFLPFFEQTGVTIPTSKTNRFTSWGDLIIKRSRERPRDAIQFVAMLINAAIKCKHAKISQEVVADTLRRYSSERVDDISKEVESECPQLKEVIRSFANLSLDRDAFKASADCIMNHLVRLPGRMGIFLLGKSLGTNRNDAFLLWRFLFDVGFFGARIETEISSDQPKGFDHLMALKTPDLVKSERWNDMQKCTWEINPAYRDFLISENIGIHLK